MFVTNLSVTVGNGNSSLDSEQHFHWTHFSFSLQFLGNYALHIGLCKSTASSVILTLNILLIHSELSFLFPDWPFLHPPTVRNQYSIRFICPDMIIKVTMHYLCSSTGRCPSVICALNTCIQVPKNNITTTTTTTIIITITFMRDKFIGLGQLICIYFSLRFPMYKNIWSSPVTNISRPILIK